MAKIVGKGSKGLKGDTGAPGLNFNLKGEVATEVALNALTGNSTNDCRIVTSTGNFYVWTGSSWYDAGQIVGPAGANGSDGSNGSNGRGISTVSRTSGTGAAGSTDTYTITFTDSSTSTFTCLLYTSPSPRDS